MGSLLFSTPWQIQDGAVFWDSWVSLLSLLLFSSLWLLICTLSKAHFSFLFLFFFGFYFMFILLPAFCAYRVPSHILIVGNYNRYFTTALWSFWILFLTWCSCWCTGPDRFAHLLSYTVLRLLAVVSFVLLFSMYPVMYYPSMTTCMVSGLLYGFVYHQ